MFSKSDYMIIGAAFFSLLFSVALWFGMLGSNVQDNRDYGAFVGLWVPSILAFGIYIKLATRRKL